MWFALEFQDSNCLSQIKPRFWRFSDLDLGEFYFYKCDCYAWRNFCGPLLAEMYFMRRFRIMYDRKFFSKTVPFILRWFCTAPTAKIWLFFYTKSRYLYFEFLTIISYFLTYLLTYWRKTCFTVMYLFIVVYITACLKCETLRQKLSNVAFYGDTNSHCKRY